MILSLVAAGFHGLHGHVTNRGSKRQHLLLKSDPRKTFPDLKDDMLGNLKRLKKTMSAMDWQDFETWMHKWLLFEMAKGPKMEEQNTIPAEKAPAPTQPPSAEPEEVIFSGVDMVKAK